MCARVCVHACVCVCMLPLTLSPTNPASEANQPSEEFYNELYSVLVTIPTDMIATWKILMLV